MQSVFIHPCKQLVNANTHGGSILYPITAVCIHIFRLVVQSMIPGTSTLVVGSYVWVACNAIISSRLNKIENQLLKIPWNVRKMPIQFTFWKWMLKSIVNVHSNSPKRQLLSHVRLWNLIQSLQVCLRLTYFTIYINQILNDTDISCAWRLLPPRSTWLDLDNHKVRL